MECWFIRRLYHSEGLTTYAEHAYMPRARDERSDLIFLERTRRLDDDRLSVRPRLLPRWQLLPESSKSLRKELQESMLLTDSESSESSFESHSIAGKAWTLSSKLSANSPHANLESSLAFLPSLDPLATMALFCSTSKACVAGEYPLNIVSAIVAAIFSYNWMTIGKMGVLCDIEGENMTGMKSVMAITR